MVSPARPEISTSTTYLFDAPAAVGARGEAEFSVTMRRDMHDNVMTVAGELDVASAPKLADALRRLEHSQHKDLSLDCAGIRFCDCAGLSVLITAARRRRAAGGWLRLVNPSAALRRISGLAGVGPILGINQIEIVQNSR
jgi:anti-anti-sigma factor